jgi:hypothetical protein
MAGNARLALLYADRVYDMCHMDDRIIRAMSRAKLCELMEELDGLESQMCDILSLIADKRSRAKDVTNKVIEELKKRGNS